MDLSKTWLVETDWLADHLKSPDLVVLDGSWHLPDTQRDAHQDYLAGHIPGAIFFDVDEIADTSSDLPHMLPSPIKFSARMRRMGIGDGMRIVAYDTSGIFAAARVWWTFRVMGANDVVVLNGGLKKWRAEGRPLEDLAPPLRTERHFTSRFNQELVRDKDNILALLETKSSQIIDARPEDRFLGEAPEPRPGLSRGHIPGSLNLPAGRLLNEDGTLRPASEIKALFKEVGTDLSQPIVTSCGSGMTASILALALAVIGHRKVAIYDGSWAEWGAPAKTEETADETNNEAVC